MASLSLLLKCPSLLSSLSLRRSQVIEKFEALDIENPEHMEINASSGLSSETRQGRSEKRVFPRKRVSQQQFHVLGMKDEIYSVSQPLQL